MVFSERERESTETLNPLCEGRMEWTIRILMKKAMADAIRNKCGVM